MSLILSRLVLNPFSKSAMLLAADPTRLHEALYALFEKEESGRILFRVDTTETGPSVLLQSAVEPNWEKLQLSERDLREKPASKMLEVNVSAGTALSFRLLARATKVASSGKGNPRGPRRDLRTDEERLAWLHRKAEESGFKVTTCGLTLYAMPSIKSQNGFRAKGGSFSAVRFDGELVVTDPEKLRAAVKNGIGTQKAFGFGLLSLGST